MRDEFVTQGHSGLIIISGTAVVPFDESYAERTLSPHDMNRQECRTKRIDSVCGGSMDTPMRERRIKWGGGEGETLSIHVESTQCALGLKRITHWCDIPDEAGAVCVRGACDGAQQQTERRLGRGYRRQVGDEAADELEGPGGGDGHFDKPSFWNFAPTEFLFLKSWGIDSSF